MSYGAQTKLGIGRQAAANSWITNAGSFFALGFLNESVGLSKQEIISQNNTGRFEQGATYSGPAQINGTILVELTPISMLASLSAWVSNSATIVDSGAVRTWQFLPNTTDFNSILIKPPQTLYKQWTDAASAELFYDCQFDQLEFQFSQGQFLKAQLTCAGGTRLNTGIGSLSVVPLASDVGLLYPWNVSSISLGGSGLSNFSDIKVSLNDNIDALYTMNGTLTPFKFTRTGFREVTVSGTFYMTDRSMLNAFVNEIQQQLLITIVNTKTAIQSGYYNSLVIDIPQLKVTDFKPATQGPGEVAVPFTARGLLDPNSSYVIKFTLVNSYQQAL